MKRLALLLALSLGTTLAHADQFEKAHQEALGDCNIIMNKLLDAYGRRFDCVLMPNAPPNMVAVKIPNGSLPFEVTYSDPLDVDGLGYHAHFNYSTDVVNTLII